MKVQINSNDNGSGMITTLIVLSNYNPQNKQFYKIYGTIEEDDFIGCFPENKQDKVIEQMQSGKIIFEVKESILNDKCKKLFR